MAVAEYTDRRKTIKGVSPKDFQHVVRTHNLGRGKGHAENLIKLNNAKLIEEFRDRLDDDETFSPDNILSGEFFASNLTALRGMVQNTQIDIGIRRLIRVLADIGDSMTGDREKIFNTMLATGSMRFDLLPMMFPPDTHIVEKEPGQPEGGIVTAVNIHYGMTGMYISIRWRRMISDGNKLAFAEQYDYLDSFPGRRKIDELPIRKITPEEKLALTERGRKYVEYASKPHHMSYTGKMTYKAGWFSRELDATGRFMIDISSYYRMTDDKSSHFREHDVVRVVSEDVLFTCPNTIQGFSLTKKRWGTFALSGISPVVYNKSSFDKLVLNASLKKQLVSMIGNQDNLYSDFVTGKGGGIIALLASPPGLGKTATCETIAEYMSRPLYSISVGELGVNPSELESNLQNVLNLSTAWNAIVLLDEGDIYLTKRVDGDILRNAMVGVFLRQLEYHNGVIFITTNRSHDIDPAILSRMSLLIKYPEFDRATRTKVWETILTDAKMGKVDPQKWLGRPLNGRTIKNVIRVSRAMGGDHNVNIGQILDQHDAFYESERKEVAAGKKTN